MNKRTEWPVGLQLGVADRWGEATVLEAAHEYGRYIGPVFVHGDWIIQHIGDGCAVVHRADTIEWNAASHRSLAPGLTALNDRTLAIYCMGDRRIAYPREFARSRPHQSRTTPATSRRARQTSYVKRSAVSGTVGLSVALALASCTSHKLATPDGRDRIAVNTPDSLSRYQDVVARQEAMTLEKSDLQRKIDALNAQVASLKAYVYSQQDKTTPASTLPEQLRPPAKTVPLSHTAPISREAAPASEAVKVSADRMIFRVHHSTGQVNFAPTAALEAELLKAARAATSIAIRGRTDSTIIDPLETQIALGRAISARDYLVKSGVKPGKIRMWYRAAGDFIADNATAIGRSENRRVDIETRGLAAAPSQPPVALTGNN